VQSQRVEKDLSLLKIRYVLYGVIKYRNFERVAVDGRAGRQENLVMKSKLLQEIRDEGDCSLSGPMIDIVSESGEEDHDFVANKFGVHSIGDLNQKKNDSKIQLHCFFVPS